MDLKKYEVFVKTVECGSLSEAGRVLGYTQSNVTHMIQGLETYFGFSLMLRNKGGIILTENGKKILPFMEKVLEDNRHMMQVVEDINGLETGVLRIGTFVSVATQWLPECIQQFKQDFPGIQIELFDYDPDEIESKLMEGKLDIGFLTDRENLKVEFLALYQDEMRAILPDQEPYNQMEVYPVKRYETDPFIFPTQGMDWDVNNIIKKEKISPYKAYFVHGDDAIIAMVEHGLGVGLLPDLFLRERNLSLLVKSLEPRHYRIIGLGYSRYETNQRIVRKFTEYLQKVVKKKYGRLLK
ncbi:MAG: LysR family transcriptional regulator [Lachnospiraceae bacterium]|nr:LysR family transcriptional regulator [Lachnospiraceae bacterium]